MEQPAFSFLRSSAVRLTKWMKIKSGLRKYFTIAFASFAAKQSTSSTQALI